MTEIPIGIGVVSVAIDPLRVRRVVRIVVATVAAGVGAVVARRGVPMPDTAARNEGAIVTTTILDQAETLDELVFQALGAASMCWETPERAGVFDSTRAQAIGDELVARIREQMREPRLGYATTRQLLGEITARIEVDGANGGGGLDYTTVGGRSAGGVQRV